MFAENECNCVELEKELALSYYSEEDGNTYRLPFMNTQNPNGEALPLPDGSLISYEEGVISSLFTGLRIFFYELDPERGVLTELELLADEELEITRYINIFTKTQWDRFSCDPNIYHTDEGEEVHFCLHEPEPEYEGIIKFIEAPDGEIVKL